MCVSCHVRVTTCASDLDCFVSQFPAAEFSPNNKPAAIKYAVSKAAACFNTAPASHMKHERKADRGERSLNALMSPMDLLMSPLSEEEYRVSTELNDRHRD